MISRPRKYEAAPNACYLGTCGSTGPQVHTHAVPQVDVVLLGALVHDSARALAPAPAAQQMRAQDKRTAPPRVMRKSACKSACKSAWLKLDTVCSKQVAVLTLVLVPGNKTPRVMCLVGRSEMGWGEVVSPELALAQPRQVQHQQPSATRSSTNKHS